MVEKNLSRRERKKIETRQRLMKSALELFREHGYDAATVEQIAEAADVAKSTFFNYFEAKEAILPALAEWRFQQLEAELSPEQGAPASPVARIKLILRLVAQEVLVDSALLRRFWTTGTHRVDLNQVHALTDLFDEQVRQAQDAGEIRTDLSPVYLRRVICAMLFQQLMIWHCNQESTPLPELLDGTVDVLLEGIAGPKWRHSS